MSSETPAARPTLGLHAAAAVVVLASASILALEIVVQRLVVPYVGLTLDTATAAIGVALAGIALGTYLGGRTADRIPPRRTLGPCFLVAGVLVLLARPLVLWLGPAVQGGGPGAVMLLTTLAVAAPITVLAAVPPAVIKTRLADLGQTGAVVGRIDALSTLGALAGTFVTGYVLLGDLSTSQILGGTALSLLAVGALLTVLLSTARFATLGPVGLLALLAGTLLVTVSGPCEYETRYYCARVEVPVDGSASERLLYLDDLRHSQVDLDDPTALEFTYTQRFADVLSAIGEPGEQLDTLHLGGGGFTMPRWLAATRPGSTSTVLELDPQVVSIGRNRLGLDEVPGVTVRTGDARTSLVDEPDDAYDAVIGDAFGSLSVPWHLTTIEFARDVARVLRPGGTYVLNVIDNPPLDFVRAEAATLAEVFDDVTVLADPRQIAGETGGNFVLVAGDDPPPSAELAAAAAARGEPGGIAAGADAAAFHAGGKVLSDDSAPVDQLITPLYAVRRG